jgi:hypothetical protein
MPDKLVEYILSLRKSEQSPSDAVIESVVLTGTEEQKLAQFIASFPRRIHPHGQHDRTLMSVAGKLRQTFKMDAEQMMPILVGICERCCVGHGADYIDMCERKAASAARYRFAKKGACCLGVRNTKSPISKRLPR